MGSLAIYATVVVVIDTIGAVRRNLRTLNIQQKEKMTESIVPVKKAILTCHDNFLYVSENSTVKGPFITFMNRSNGDIVQLRKLTDDNGVMRNALPPTSELKWNYLKDYDGKYIIPYVIKGTYEISERDIILQAMTKVEKNACIRFHIRSNEKDYIEIQNNEGEGCYSTVGRYGGKSIVSLEASKLGSCMQEHTVIHELLHVVGLWHEHMREDRDKYITIHWENIQKGYQNQFALIEAPDAVTYGVPYDYMSIMHYGKTAFANPNTISMEPMDKKYLDLIGTATEPSRNDWAKVCMIYNCSVCMGKKVVPGQILATTATTLKPGCTDKDPLNCYFMDKNGTLDCNKYMNMCCGTCAALGSASTRAPTTTEEPLAFKTLPPGRTSTPSHHVCTDRDGVQQCEQLVKYNKLNCFTVEGTARCCGTCNALMDYIETVASYT